MTKEQLKAAVCAAIDAHREELIALGEDIFYHPELGYKEVRTAGLVTDALTRLGLTPRTGLGVTGVKARAAGRNPGPTVAILGELDAVVSPQHPHADPHTGAAHACGHNAQITNLIAAATGLLASGAMEHLDGQVVFLATPAEEYVELEYRQKLREEGTIRFFGGKQELIRLGEFEDIDLAMMVHGELGQSGREAWVGGDTNGFVGKVIQYRGREAHAGGAPHLGVNALNAAMLGMMAIHAQRETFKDEDAVRVHPVLTKGGDMVNIVPADVRMETYVRGRTMEAILDASHKVNRALEGAAYAIGAAVEIVEIPGYLPLQSSPGLTRLYAQNARELLGEDRVHQSPFFCGSGDVGDLSALMPVILPSQGGYAGAAHSKDVAIVDRESVYLVPAKLMAMSVIDLLWDGAAAAREIVSDFTPQLNRESYLKFWEDFQAAEEP